MTEEQVRKKDYLMALLTTPSDQREPITNNPFKFNNVTDEELMEDMTSTVGFKDIKDTDIQFWAYSKTEEELRRDSSEKVFKDESYNQAREDCIKNIIIKKMRFSPTLAQKMIKKSQSS